MILTTTLYEKNFRHVLKTDNWFFKFNSPLITKKLIIVNNISSQIEFNSMKKEFEDKAHFVYSDDIWEEAVKAFNCDLHKGEISYWYSIQYFCALYVGLQDGINYVFNVGADCYTEDLEMDDFLRDSSLLLDEDPSVLLTTIPWTKGDFEPTGIHEQNIYNINKRHDSFWFSKVVSDRVFLASPKKLQEVNFNIKQDIHPFPGYGGYSFEKRLCNHMIISDFYRAIYKKYDYHHESF